MTQSGLWIVVPAYQEAAQIERTLSDLAAYLPRLVVVDDGSSDATSASAARAGAVVLRHAVNLGQGAALQTGIDYALRNGATHVCTFDADGQHDSDSIGRMFAALVGDEAHVALASRFLGTTTGMPALRRAALRIAVYLTRLHTGLKLTDTHNGLRIFTREAARRTTIRQCGMAHGSEILSGIAREKLRYIEVPTVVHYTEYSRRKGQSLSNGINILFDLLYAAWSR